jgi:hypothetical protein
MPIVSRLVTLGTTVPTEVVGHDNTPHDVILHNHTKSSNEYIYIGGSTAISTTNSMHIDPGQTIYLTLRPGDRLFAVSDPDGLELGVTDIRKND